MLRPKYFYRPEILIVPGLRQQNYMDLLIIVFLIGILGICAAESKCGPAEYKNKDDECCPMCGKGYVVHRDCTEMSSTTCIPCVGDTYMGEPNGLNKCFKCKTCDFNQGLNTQQKCTTFGDAVCAVLPGYFCGSIQDNECTFGVKHSLCSPGQGVKIPGTERTDTVCEDCKEGYFSRDGANCTEHTNCAVLGEELEEKGSPTKDNKCRKPQRRRAGLIAVIIILLVLAFPLFLRWHQLYHICKVAKTSDTTGSAASQNLQTAVQETDQDNPSQDTPSLP
ncbi:tumor necrosis factor receptor superfamily member 14-like isoform X2 [Sardina pilchardus]|uniref:tumor necrosis factor receptor superfamily member 14-like isoform X2 n=1 Tax=Sardina pilchardus TaxID=27697 RepID=UPI002E0EFFE5